MITWDDRCLGRLVGAAVVICVWSSGNVRAADMAPDQPEYGVRFTPGMARAMAGDFTRDLLKGRYELPADKVEEAQEKVARRLMQMAHKIEEPGQELVERMIAAKMRTEADRQGESALWAGLGKEFADRVLPVMPEIRELVRGVSQDVRPMLPIKQQLRMAADLGGAGMVINAFEETMKKWASGEIKDFQDPFNAPRRIKKDENGETETLKAARQKAQKKANKPRAGVWAAYVESFKRLYDLDPGEAAAADSILREFTEREKTLRSDPRWRDRIYRGQMWDAISWELPDAWFHPVRTLIEEENRLARRSWNQLEEEFKARLETIVTSNQRRAAEEKVEALLKAKGLQLAESKP